MGSGQADGSVDVHGDRASRHARYRIPAPVPIFAAAPSSVASAGRPTVHARDGSGSASVFRSASASELATPSSISPGRGA
jgi:hypothetical protein